MTPSISSDEWFERSLIFNTHMDFEEILLHFQIPYKRIECDSGTMYVWCSDWNQYQNNRETPVLYIDAHYDTVCQTFVTPQRIEDRVVATWHDNRSSCNVLCKSIESGKMMSTKYIIYVLFSDGEERGMLPLIEWYRHHRCDHQSQRFIVMDVTDQHGDNLGLGVYSFIGEPLEQYIQPSDDLCQQIDDSRESYPDNLCCTHAGLLYHKFRAHVGRMGLPVAGDNSSLHGLHTEISLSDLNQYYKKLCLIVMRME
jgi:hypothetical protein